MAYVLSDNDLPADYRHWLHIIKANPEKQFWSALAKKVGELTETGMVRAAVGTLVYSMFSLVEGVGLMFRAKWAGYLTIGESAFFIPIEVFELVKEPKNTVIWVIMLLNIFIVLYLFQNRERLFKHHLQAESSQAAPERGAVKPVK